MTGFLSRRLIPLCLGKDSEGLQGIYPLFIPMCGNFFNGLVPFGTRFLVLSPPPRLRSLSRGYRRTRALRHLVSRWLVDVFDARFGVIAFSAPRLRLVAELKLFCRCTAFLWRFGYLFLCQNSPCGFNRIAVSRHLWYSFQYVVGANVLTWFGNHGIL